MPNPIQTQSEHKAMVQELVKPGSEVAHAMTARKVSDLAGAIRLCMIAEQALSNAKRFAIYNKNVSLFSGEEYPLVLPDANAPLCATNMTVEQADLLHAAVGIATEALELLGSVANSSLGGMQVDEENNIEELGDIEFYMEQFRQRSDATRDEVLRHNITKLRKRYPEGKFSDKQAVDRADKTGT